MLLFVININFTFTFFGRSFFRKPIMCLGAIQIIRDTLGGGGVSKNVTWQFLLVISVVKVDKTCHRGGGGGLKSVEKVSHII